VDFAKAVAEERKRLNGAISELNKQKAEIDKDIKKLQLEIDAINAYESAKKGMPVGGVTSFL